MSDAMFDVRQEQYAAVIRDMIRHEDDVTNHRIMWLLVGQGFFANAFVAVKTDGNVLALCAAGIFLTLSAFAMLYSAHRL